MEKINLYPLDDKVVVLPDTIDEKLGSGILVKAETTKRNDNRTQTKGTLVAIADCAFDEWSGEKPKVGDRVLFAMYSGQFYTEDEVEYRIMRSDDVVGILKGE